nr:hypothetical protein Ade03nite_26850 [Actinoplanes derwentensis]
MAVVTQPAVVASTPSCWAICGSTGTGMDWIIDNRKLLAAAAISSIVGRGGGFMAVMLDGIIDRASSFSVRRRESHR